MKLSYMLSLAAALLIAWPMSGPAAAQADSERITKGANVTIEMTITVPEERVVIPNYKSQYTHGSREIIPGLEDALAGMKAGDKKHVELEADQAFGAYDASKKVSVERKELPEKIQVGDITTTTDGQAFTVLALSDKEAVIDFNHPLAGKHIVLDVRILDVKRKS